jgi:serine/threonine protein kinase
MVGEALHDGSRLAMSLERGRFSQSFESWEVIGSGGFGKVLKAWHIDDKKWYAVKLITVNLRADQTLDEGCDLQGCSAELFAVLKSLRSTSVIRYFHRWAELPEDISDNIVPEEHKTTSMDNELDSFVLPDAYDSSVDSAWGFKWLAESTDEGHGNRSRDLSPLKADTSRKMCRVVLAIQMEFCEGVNLDKYMMQPHLHQGSALASSLEGTLGIFKQLMHGLAEMHRMGIVHRDIKPENVMVSSSGQLKIIDLDLARWAVGPQQRVIESAALWRGFDCESLTEVGTPGYAPPEQCTIKANISPTGVKANSSPFSSPATTASLPTDSLPGTSNGTPSSSPTTMRPRMAPCVESDVFSAAVVLVELLMAVVKKGAAWNTAMERAAAIQALTAGQGDLAALPKEVRRLFGMGTCGWLRQLMFRMLAWDAHVRPSSEEVLSELQTRLNSKDRQNPYVGVLRGSSPQLSAMGDHPMNAQNPYIGFFLDHAPRPLEITAVQ